MFNILHNKDVEGDIVHLSWKGINSTQGFSCHMCIDCISVHVPGPILALLYQCRSKDTTLPWLNKALQHTEATVQDDTKSTTCMDGLCKTQQQTNSFPAKMILEWEWSQFDQPIFSLYQLQLIKDPGLTTADGVVFIPHWVAGCGFLGMKIHPGQENFDIQTLMDSSSKQDTQAGLVILSLKETINCLTSWILSLNNGKGTSVYLRAARIELRHRFVIIEWRRNRVP